MPYITIPIIKKNYQVSFEDLITGVSSPTFNNRDTKDTRTVFRESTPRRLLEKVSIEAMIQTLLNFNERYKPFIELENKAELYNSFKIPKRSGGWRHIDAPNEDLKIALRELKYLFEQKLFALYHTSAYAYIKGRSTLDDVKRHQANKSNFFLKLDFHNFFGSTTLEFLLQQFAVIFPFNEILAKPEGEEALKKSLSLAFLNNKLPQGTPISPLLTNIMMIPVDHMISREMREMTPHICYTRYADDLLLSSKLSFDKEIVEGKIIDILTRFNAPFEINVEKTQYKSRAGRNWNLGVMLNKDNQITIGYKKKKQFKVMLFSLIRDYQNGTLWPVDEAQHLQGIISYYRMVEKDNIDKIIHDYSNKYNVDVEKIIKKALNNKTET